MFFVCRNRNRTCEKSTCLCCFDWKDGGIDVSGFPLAYIKRGSEIVMTSPLKKTADSVVCQVNLTCFFVQEYSAVGTEMFTVIFTFC